LLDLLDALEVSEDAGEVYGAFVSELARKSVL
jgi:hypothetical protein